MKIRLKKPQGVFFQKAPLTFGCSSSCSGGCQNPNSWRSTWRRMTTLKRHRRNSRGRNVWEVASFAANLEINVYIYSLHSLHFLNKFLALDDFSYQSLQGPYLMDAIHVLYLQLALTLFGGCQVGIQYLMQANSLIHQLEPNAKTVAEAGVGHIFLTGNFSLHRNMYQTPGVGGGGHLIDFSRG